MPYNNKGIGEWKELTREVRTKIPYPLVYRPIRNSHGYTILESDWKYSMGIKGRWECRPLHPADAWHVYGEVFYGRLYTYFLHLFTPLFLKYRYAWHTTGGEWSRWPFERIINNSYSRIHRFLLWWFYRF